MFSILIINRGVRRDFGNGERLHPLYTVCIYGREYSMRDFDRNNYNSLEDLFDRFVPSDRAERVFPDENLFEDQM